MEKHRGEIVKEAVLRSGLPINKLAERLKISRNTLYNRFKDPEVSYEFIVATSKIIHYDFTIDFPELKTEGNEMGDGAGHCLDRDTVELLKLEKKYIDLLERYNKLLVMLVKLASTNELEVLRKEILRFLES